MVTQSPIRQGDILVGKYSVDRVLGAGGMGMVVAARHLQLDEPVAIKFLLPQMLEQPELVERFARESRAAIKIKSEHGVRVMDVGSLEDGTPFMVMELLRGRDLAAMVQAQGPLPIADSLVYALQACEALAEAHALGIVHRDLKPANLFLTHRSDQSACIKVLDFGISKLASSTANASMTRTHDVMGSPLYMSPEQATSARDVDMRADIWSLGAVLFELLSGRAPFEGDNVPQLWANILTAPPAPLRQLRPELPEGLEQVVLKCLAKDRNHRWSNVGELALALAPFGPTLCRRSAERICRVLSSAGLGEPVSLPLGASSVIAVAQTSPAATGSSEPNKTRRIVIAIALAAGALVLMVATGFLVVRSTGSSRSVQLAALPLASESAPVVSSAPRTSDSAPIAPSASVALVRSHTAPETGPPASVPVPGAPPPKKIASAAPAVSVKPPVIDDDNLFKDNH